MNCLRPCRRPNAGRTSSTTACGGGHGDHHGHRHHHHRVVELPAAAAGGLSSAVSLPSNIDRLSDEEDDLGKDEAEECASDDGDDEDEDRNKSFYGRYSDR